MNKLKKLNKSVKMIIGGIDEAGRGPVIGPLIIAGVTFKKDKIKRLKRIGVRDSKKINPKKRKNLEPQIKDLANEYYIKEISPKKIDEIMAKNSLNQLETIEFTKIIKKLKSDKLYSDYIDKNSKYKLENSKKEIIVKKKADDLYPSVSAASILAKVKRDQTIDKINNKTKEGPEIGSGYPSDKKTQEFLKWWYKNNKEFPNYVRKSWKTLDKIRTTIETQKLIN